MKSLLLISVAGAALGFMQEGVASTGEVVFETWWPCDVIDDQCNPLQQRLIAGYFAVRRNSIGTFFSIKALHGVDDCGANHYGGTVPSGDKLVVAMGNLFVLDGGTTPQFFEAGIEIHSWANANSCTGTLTFKGADFPYYTSPGDSYQMGYGDLDAACNGTEGDPGVPTLHLPDVAITRPSGTGTVRACYNIKLWGRTCTSAYTNCQPWTYKAGDVVIDWL